MLNEDKNIFVLVKYKYSCLVFFLFFVKCCNLKEDCDIYDVCIILKWWFYYIISVFC